MRHPVVLFDVGGTLIGPSESFGAVYSRAVAELGLDLAPERAESGLQETLREMDRLVPPGRDRYALWPGGEDEYWLRFARRTLERAGGAPVGLDLAARALVRIRAAFLECRAWQVFPDVRPALEELVRDGARLGVVSNWDSRLPRVLELLELRGYFEALGISHLEGIEKPDPELFHRVLRRLGARPDEALHVGDVPALDGVGARAAGVQVVLIDRRRALDPALGALRDVSRIPSLARDGL